MISKHMKRCSTSLALREMQIKTVMRYILMRMANDKTSKLKSNQRKKRHFGGLADCGRGVSTCGSTKFGNLEEKK